MTRSTEKLLAFFSRCNWLLQWFILSLLALVLYAPIIGNSFLNDDFIVLKKVCLENKLNTNGFFRPLSDITLYGNYLLGGFNPVGFYLTNILVHALNGLLLFRFFVRWRLTDDNRQQLYIATIAAILFLTYPFHNESVAWLLGRGSSMAGTFVFLTLLILTSKWRDHWKLPAAACCYFIAMTAYESAFILPAIIFAWQIFERTPWKKIFTWMFVLTLVLVAHLVVRVQVSGSITGEYGANLLGFDPGRLISSVAKVMGRLVVPPQKNSMAFIIMSISAYILVAIAVWKFWKKHSTEKTIWSRLLSLAAMTFFALLLPFYIGVSTNSSENDRFLYLASFFICGAMAFMLVKGLFNSRWLPWLAAGILTYNIVFLEVNNLNWRTASESVTSLLQIIKEKPGKGKLYVVNLPDEKNGAFIFRVGFHEALAVHRLDTSAVVVVNRATRRELEELPAIVHRYHDYYSFIPPCVLVQGKGDSIPMDTDKYHKVLVGEQDRVVYWNAHRWVLMP